jgi:hypothetical protein
MFPAVPVLRFVTWSFAAVASVGNSSWPTPYTWISACVSGYSVSVSRLMTRSYCWIFTVIAAIYSRTGPSARARPGGSTAMQRLAKHKVDEAGSRYGLRPSQAYWCASPSFILSVSCAYL